MNDFDSINLKRQKTKMLGPKQLLEKTTWNQWFNESLNRFKNQSNLLLKRKECELKSCQQPLPQNKLKNKSTQPQSLIEKREVKIWKSYLKFLKNRIFINCQIVKWFSNTDHLIEQADKILKMFINQNRGKVEISITNEPIVVEKIRIFRELKLNNQQKDMIHLNSKRINIMKRVTSQIRMN